MVSRVIPVESFDLVIFGATGDLAKRKILPGLYRRYVGGQIPEGARIVGAARAEMDDAAFGQSLKPRSSNLSMRASGRAIWSRGFWIT